MQFMAKREHDKFVKSASSRPAVWSGRSIYDIIRTIMKLRKNISDNGVRHKRWAFVAMRGFVVAAMLPMMTGCFLLVPDAGNQAESNKHQKANTK